MCAAPAVGAESSDTDTGAASEIQKEIIAAKVFMLAYGSIYPTNTSQTDSNYDNQVIVISHALYVLRLNVVILREGVISSKFQLFQRSQA